MTSLKSTDFSVQDLDLLADFDDQEVEHHHQAASVGMEPESIIASTSTTTSSPVVLSSSVPLASTSVVPSSGLTTTDEEDALMHLTGDDGHNFFDDDQNIFASSSGLDMSHSLPTPPPLVVLPKQQQQQGPQVSDTVLSSSSSTRRSNETTSQSVVPGLVQMKGSVTEATSSSGVISMDTSQSLSDFITSIKPPVIPGVSSVASSSAILPNTITIQTSTSSSTGQLKTTSLSSNINLSNIQMLQRKVIPSTVSVKKQTSSGGVTPIVIPGNSSSLNIVGNTTYKLIIPSSQTSSSSSSSTTTSSGKQQPQLVLQAASSLQGNKSNAAGQQIVFLSPVKQQQQTTVKTPGLKTLAPAVASTSNQTQTIKLIASKDKTGIMTTGGQAVQVIRLMTSSASASQKTTTLRSIAPSLPGNKVTLIPATNSTKTSTGSTATFLTGSAAAQFLQSNTSSSSSSSPQVIMLPANLLSSGILQGKASSGQPVKIHVSSSSDRKQTNFIPIAPSPLSSHSTIHPSSKEVLTGLQIKQQQQLNQQHHHLNVVNGSGVKSRETEDSSSGKKKPCNCSKSQCLKLYCDCFANGEFCRNCNCNNCFNNLDHEEDRQKAIRQCLERNPFAFHPKIGKGKITGDVTERRHTKGCNCRRSGCLKNYCECFEAKINCTELCKCNGCKNYEDSYERKSLQLMSLADAAEFRSAQQTAASKIIWGSDYTPKLPVPLSSHHRIGPCSFITQEVIDATCQCLMATAEEGEKKGLDSVSIERSLVLELGRCLKQIIDSSNQTKL